MRISFQAIYLTLCGALVIFSACRKKGNDHSDVTFINQVSKVVTLDIYTTADDYYNNTGRIIRKTLQPNEKLVFTKADLPSGKTYWADWYDDERYYNNWFNDDSKPADAFVSFKPIPGANTYYLKPSLRGQARFIFLPDSNRSTWTAVNAFTGNKNEGYKSYWDQLSANEKIRSVTVRKNFTLQYNYLDANGGTASDTYPFKVHNSETAYIEFITDDVNKYGSLESGFLPVSTKPEYASDSKDTLMATLPGSDLRFMMVRQ
jgi:hypothetical protein